jgi:hypothetical protein
MIAPPTGTPICIAWGVTDLRRGFTGLSAQMQTVPNEKSVFWSCFVVRGRRGDLIKLRCRGTATGCAFLQSGWRRAVSLVAESNRIVTEPFD